MLLFAPDRARLDAELPGLLARMPQTAILWVAYPKLSSRTAELAGREPRSREQLIELTDKL